MSRIKIFILFFILLCQVQISGRSLNPYEKIYYWFYIKIDKAIDKETGSNRIIIKNIGSEIESGTFSEFLSSHQNGLKSGKIIIGPFGEKGQSQDAQSYYRNTGKYTGSSEEAASFGEDNNYTFFYMKPVGENLSQSIIFERIPSRVTSGNIEDFMFLLIEGLSFDKLAIGPFDNYELAERSKFAYVKNGETDSDNKNDSIRNQGLKIMAKKWKSLNLEIIKQSENKELNKTTYRFNTKFPRKYFATDAYQIITIKALYTEPVDISSNSFTLQGDGVVDNNPVVSFDMGTVYINILNFDKYKDNKIKGFSFESFIYNDYEIMELDPIFVAIK
jgi:hypothetical protein